MPYAENWSVKFFCEQFSYASGMPPNGDTTSFVIIQGAQIVNSFENRHLQLKDVIDVSKPLNIVGPGKQTEKPIEGNLRNHAILPRPEICEICLEELQSDVMRLICEHLFHKECIKKLEKTSCPKCRAVWIKQPELIYTS
jgi:hypothetical protein